MSTTLITSRDPKGLQFVSLCEVAYNKAKLDTDRAQRLNENGGEFQAGLRELIERFSLSGQFTDEEVASSYLYPPEYKGPKPIVEQVKLLAEAFSLSSTATLEYIEQVASKWTLPDGAEGLCAIPRWEKVADTYNAALEKVLALLAKQRKFYNYRQGELGPQYLRQHARTVAMLETISQQQPGDILVFPFQYGMRHRGRSTRRAREVLRVDEFALGAFAGGCQALVHPDRYVRWEELDTDFPGDEFSPGADGRFSRAPFFYFYDGELGFGAEGVGSADDFYGSVSGFVPPDPQPLST